MTTTKTSVGALIEIHDLRVTKAKQTIFRLADLAVGIGERVAIVGPNGSGKTTLLRVVAGLETEFRGQLRISVSPRERVYLHQSPYLFRGTVLQNVAYGLAARGVPRVRRLEIAQEWLDRLGIPEFGDRSVDGLSGGERRRVALARVCAVQPELLLLDEPLAELDEQGMECVERSLADLSGSTILIATPTPLPSEFAERIVKIPDGVQ